MASAVLPIVGGVIGGIFGGPAGFQAGMLLGSVAANVFFPPPPQEGPKLSDLKVGTSAYGMTLPVVRGTARIAGNLGWSTDLVQHKHTNSVGKGGGQQTNTYTYTVSQFWMLCQGPISGISRIWANSVLVYDMTNNSASGIIASTKFSAQIRIMLGTEDQMPDPLMQATDGVGSTPAYRGIAGIMLQDLDLTPWNGAVPNLEFEVVANGATVGGRLLSFGSFALDQAGSAERGQLYTPVTEGDYQGGQSDGYAIIASVASNAMDVVAMHLPDGRPENEKRWTFDEVGNCVAAGSLGKDYPYIQSVIGSYNSPPDWPTPHGGAYQNQWMGKAGELHMYLNRGGPLEIGGVWLSDNVGGFPSTYDPIIVGGAGETFDSSGFYRQLCSVATGFIHGVFPSHDGALCIATTGPSRQDGESTFWHRFSFAGKTCTYEASGPIAAGNLICGFGRQTGNYGVEQSGMAEEDGIHLWTVAGDNSSTLACYEIGGDGTMSEALSIALPSHAGFQVPFSIFASGGVAFIASNIHYGSATRQASVSTATVSLASVVLDICSRAGMNTENVDVSSLDQQVAGVVFANQMTYRSMLESLFTAYFVDATESGGKLKCVKRGGGVAVVIPEDDLACRDAMSLDEPPDQMKISRIQDLELACKVKVDYFAIGADLIDGSQEDTVQLGTSLNVMSVSLPMALTDDEAATIARKMIYSQWASRETYQFATNLKYSHIEPTDIVTVYKDADPKTMRITKRTDGADGVISWEGISENPTVYDQTAIGGIVKGSSQVLSLPGPTDLLVLDAPAFTDNYGVAPLVYLAGNGFDTTWNGASLMQSLDGGDTYQDTGVSLSAPCIIGRTSSVLPPPAIFGMWDEINTLDVFLSNGAAELTSDTELNVLAGFNTAYVGGEIVGFKVATQIGLREYRLSGLLRGQRGTEDWALAHVLGEDFVVLSTKNMRVENVDSSLIGQNLTFKAVTFGGPVSDARINQKQFTARNLRPFSPAQVLATKSTVSASGDWILQWNRRARSGGAWRDTVDVPYTDPVGSLSTGEFEVDILHLQAAWPDLTGATVIRTITGLGPNDIAAKYTVAQQISDFGAPTSELVMRVYQVSATVGRSPLVETFHFVYLPTIFDGGPAVVGGSIPAFNALLHFDGADLSTSIINSGIGPAFSNSGVVISTAQSKFGGSSGHFNGSASLHYTTDNAYDIGAGDCRVEAWVYLTSFTGGYQQIFDSRPPGSPSGVRRGLTIAPDGKLAVAQDGSAPESPFSLTLNEWNHCVYQRRGGIVETYYNGDRYQFLTGDTASVSTNSIIIGTDCYEASFFNGYIDELVVGMGPGSAIYAANFTPPSTPYGNANIASLALNFNGTNGSTTFIDRSPQNLSVSAFGSVAVSTSSPAIGSGFVSFTTASDYLLVGEAGSLDTSACSSLSVQFYVKPLSLSATYCLLSWGGSSASSIQDIYSINGFVNVRVRNGSNADTKIVGTVALSATAWTHVRIVWTDSTTAQIWINGSMDTSGSLPSLPDMSANTFAIGRNQYPGYPDNFTGGIDSVEIYKNVILNTGPFTPPATEY